MCSYHCGLLLLSVVLFLLSGCDLWSFDFFNPHLRLLPSLGNLRPLPAHQPRLSSGGAVTAPLPQLHLPRAGPLQHHTRGHHHHPGSECRLLHRILGERAAGADFRAPCRAPTCTSARADSSRCGSELRPFPPGSLSVSGNSAGCENTVSAGVVLMVPCSKK